jgi:hypothetical protein
VADKRRQSISVLALNMHGTILYHRFDKMKIDMNEVLKLQWYRRNTLLLYENIHYMLDGFGECDGSPAV